MNLTLNALWITAHRPARLATLHAVDQCQLRRVARNQGGLFTRAQAATCGYSPYQIRRRVAAGQWSAVDGPVLAERGLRLTPDIRDRAAALAVPGAVLAGASAARQWRIPVPDRRIYLWIGALRRAPRPGVTYLRDPLPSRETSRFEGVPLTVPARTIVDCLRFLDDPAATTLLDRALQVGWISLDDLTERVRDHTGRRGAPRLARLVAATAVGARSAAERAAIRLLRAAGIRGWRANEPIFDAAGLIGVGDLVFQAHQLVVELDGQAYHTTAERFQRDRDRQNRLVAAGWTVLRFTWRDLTERPSYVTVTILAMLQS